MGQDTRKDRAGHQKSKEANLRRPGAFVVGVGASAGGLDAISKFLGNFSEGNSEFSVVIVMHLSPDYKSELTSILKKRCKWPVVQAENNLEIAVRHIYVTPQNSNIRLEDNKLMLDALPPNYSSAPSIDHFLTSLAQGKGRQSAGIILSGFGKDGSKGVEAIKRHNGFTMAQLPETAEHRDMPDAAIATDQIDLSVPAEQMFDEIAQYIDNTHTIAQSDPPNKKSMDAIFELLEKRSGTDFARYKPSTIMRRINHRMGNLQLKSLVDYYEKIKKSPRELDVLFESVLIGVTEFFRDEKSYENFKERLKVLLENKKPGDSIRIWSVGCATGEEPYSIGILLQEILGKDIRQYQVQVFASDIDEKALNFARKGIYPKESLKKIPLELIDRYFELDGEHHYEIIKEVKQRTLFARHDISNDPPFVKLDFVVCRNLLIYFNNELQKQCFQIFHYALRPEGFLFLGKSESIGVAADLFTKTDSDKIFRKVGASSDYRERFSRFREKRNYLRGKDKKEKRRNMSIVDVAKETLYYKFQHPFVIVNDNSDIKEVHGSLRLYLEIGQGTMNANLHKMANPELVTGLKALQAQVKKTGVPHLSHIIKFELYDNVHYVRIRIAPLIYAISDEQYYMVMFQKVEADQQILDIEAKMKDRDLVDLRIKELEDELASTKEHLQVFTEELEATNEELQTINEELQSANEELKSSNEELETSNEELQSANEELNTANNELRLANDELLTKESQLKEAKQDSERNEIFYRTIAENIPNGTVGILNENYEIEYVAGKGFDKLDFEPQVIVGKKMPDLNPSEAEVAKLRHLCERTFDGETGFLKFQYDNRYFVMQTVPLKLAEINPHPQILFLSQEVTEEKRNELKLQSALEAARLFFFEYDFGEDTIHAKPPLRKLFEFDDTQIVRMKDIKDKIHPDDRAVWRKKIAEAKKTGKLWHEFRLRTLQGIKHVRINGKILYDAEKVAHSLVATLLDITKDTKLLYKVKESEERFRRIADSAPVTIWITNGNDKCTYVNQTWLEYTGSDLEDCLNDGWLKYIHPEDRRRTMEEFLEASEEREAFEMEYMVQSKDGSYGWFLNRAHPRFDDDGEFDGFVGVNIEITEQKEFTKALEKKVAERTEELEQSNEQLVQLNMNLEEYAYVASHDLQEPVRKIRTFNSLLFDKKDDGAAVVKYSEKIESSAERMTNLIRNILDYSSLNNMQYETEMVDLDQLLEELERDLELTIDENDAHVTAGNLGKVHGIRVQLFQLFSNLIRNSIKFNDNTPKITVDVEVIKGKKVPKKFKADENLDYKKLIFTDNGIGFDTAHTEDIFKPFKRLHSKMDYSGTGIGLAICKRIVDIHKGFIDVKSEKGKGSKFHVYLPVNGA